MARVLLVEDDYVGKPVELRALDARIKALMRRVVPSNRMTRCSATQHRCPGDGGLLRRAGAPEPMPANCG